MFSRRLCKVLNRLQTSNIVKPIPKPIRSLVIECPVQFNSVLRSKTIDVVYTATSFNTSQIHKYKNLINGNIESAVRLANMSNSIERPADIKYVKLDNVIYTAKYNYNVKVSKVHIGYVSKRLSSDVDSLIMFMSSFICTMAAVVLVVLTVKIMCEIIVF